MDSTKYNVIFRGEIAEGADLDAVKQGIARLFRTKWDILGWFGQSLENKPYLAVDDQNQVYVSDPEGPRILSFTTEGEFLYYWGEEGQANLNLPVRLAAGGRRGIWVSDPKNNRLLRYPAPVE